MVLISAFIITKNEETRITRAIASIQDFVDEIIVIDSGSTDRTVEIAKKMGAQVIFNKWPGYVKQKAFGESLCRNDWILNIDADEERSDELKSEIGYIFKSNTQDRYKAYKIDFVIMHRSDTKPRKYAPSNVFIRLYNKKYAGFKNVLSTTTHDAVLMNRGIVENDSVYLLNGPAYHYSGTSIEQLVAKANFYSGEQAKDLVASSRAISNIRLVFEFFTCFLKAFLIRRYFVFGMDGFVDSMIFAFARFLRLAKTRENCKN